MPFYCRNCDVKFPCLNQLLSADLPTCVRNNAPPFGIGRKELQSQVSQASDELRNMDRELARLHAAIIRVENQRSELQQHINLGKSLLSPIRRLPPEILREVFLYFCAVGVRVDGKVTAPGAVLGGVCSYWKSLVFSTRGAWSVLHVYLDRVVGSKVPILQEILGRSGTSPLQLSIKQSVSPLSSAAVDTLQLLVSHCRRWSSLCADIVQQTWLLPVLLGVQDNIPLLEHITLNNLLYKASQDSLNTIFNTAPRLRSANIGNFQQVFKIPLRQLSTVEGSFANMTVFVSKHLCHFTRAEKLVLFLHTHISTTRLSLDEVPAVELPNLSTLILGRVDISPHNIPPPILSGIFTHLRAPHLKTLKIGTANSGCLYPPEWPQPQFLSFLSTSASTLSSLSLEGLSMAPEEVLEVISILPSLDELSIDDTEWQGSKPDIGGKIITDELVARMTLFSEHSFYSLVKRLRTLKLITNGQGLKQKEFAGMIRSRCVSTDLRRLHVELKQVSFEETSVSALGSLHAAGLRIVARDRGGLILVC